MKAASLPRRLWNVAFTGIPFGVFKLGGGLAAAHDIAPLVGYAVLAWGVIDTLLNLLSVIWPQRVAHCLLSNVGRAIDRRATTAWREQAFLAIDTLLSFLIVSTMIWFDRINPLPEPIPRIWAVAVIASILGVGVERVWFTFRLRAQKPPADASP